MQSTAACMDEVGSVVGSVNVNPLNMWRNFFHMYVHRSSISPFRSKAHAFGALFMCLPVRVFFVAAPFDQKCKALPAKI
jgi:hypothetical protein